jgi:hypothetical protein
MRGVVFVCVARKRTRSSRPRFWAWMMNRTWSIGKLERRISFTYSTGLVTSDDHNVILRKTKKP